MTQMVHCGILFFFWWPTCVGCCQTFERIKKKTSLYHRVVPSITQQPFILASRSTCRNGSRGTSRGPAKKAESVAGPVPFVAAVRLNLTSQKHPAHVGWRLPPKHPNCLGLPSSKIKSPQNACIMMLPWNKVWAKNQTYSIHFNKWTWLFE